MVLFVLCVSVWVCMDDLVDVLRWFVVYVWGGLSVFI